VSKFKAVAVCLIWGCALTIPAHATTIAVTNTNDSGPGSLRQALLDANDGDTIDATGISGVITLTSGQLLVDKSVTINGAGADVLAIDGNAASLVFFIFRNPPGETVLISGFTIRNGRGNQFGAIYNEETLTITNSTISGNLAGEFGGGIFNLGTATIFNTTFTGNSAANGGAIYNPGIMTITDSTISGNMARTDGGAIFNVETLEIANSTISNNSADEGGGISNGGTLTISNTTVSGNSARRGGGAFNSDQAGMLTTNSTLSGNTANEVGGGIYNVNGATLDIGNTILNAGNTSANLLNDGGTITSLGYNLSSDDGGGVLNGPGDQINTDPALGALQDNGGPTFTHELLPGSPAIDAGDPNFTPPPFFDQRGFGFDRVVNGRIDIGSFEVQTQTVAIHLQAAGRKVEGINTVRLRWSGASSNNIDVYRNGIVVATVPNTGTYTDFTGDTGRARYTYKVCEAGTSTCSNEVTVRFRR
jgi:predicted outer membrane repeat protein